jgi:phosphatidylglycerophosphatase C
VNLALFDFDGTVTTRDTFKPFLYYATGRKRAAIGTALLGPIVAANRLNLVKTTELRRAAAYICFRGRRAAEIDETGERYSWQLDPLVRPEMLFKIRWHQAQGDEVAVVSASLAPYLRHWCSRVGVERISTELEARAGILTGRYAGKDCAGPEKARRVRARYDLARYTTIYAYGDTAEDAELLELAHERFFRGRKVDHVPDHLSTSDLGFQGKKPSPTSSLSSPVLPGRLAPLGRQRLRLLSCLGGRLPLLPGHFDPGQEEDVFAAFRAIVENAARRTQTPTDALTRSLIGAGRLFSGDLSAAFEIVEHLPAEPPVLDHGAGYCLVAPVQALKAALPTLPRELADVSRWLAGSDEQAALREWLARHGTTLRWDEHRAVYVASTSNEPVGSASSEWSVPER